MLRVRDLVKDYGHGRQRRRILDHVSFDFLKGERLAILGRNGAGKSTLLRLIGGVELPTSGTITSDMSLSWPMGLAGGFQGSLTGIDNIRFVARIYGRDAREVEEFVADFSELGTFLREPVKTYSSGMRARLALGLSFAIDFDCYLIDEVIFVGDQKFQAKCQVALFDDRASKSLILVSHDVGILREYCNGAILLNAGRAKRLDNHDDAINVYRAL